MGIFVIETFFDKKVVIMVIKIVFVDLAKSARYFVVGRYRNEVTFTQGTSEQSSAGRLAKMWTRIVSIEPTCASRVLNDLGTTLFPLQLSFGEIDTKLELNPHTTKKILYRRVTKSGYSPI